MPRLQTTTPLDGEGCGLWLNRCLIHMSSKPCPVPSSVHTPRSGEHRFSETGCSPLHSSPGRACPCSLVPWWVLAAMSWTQKDPHTILLKEFVIQKGQMGQR